MLADVVQELTEALLSEADEIQLEDPDLAESYRDLAQLNAESGLADVILVTLRDPRKAP